MNCRSTLIASILVISFVLHACPSESCLKKVRNLLRKKGKEEKPAELARDEAAFIKYSHAERSKFYLEIIVHRNKTFEVRELDHPPVALSQVKIEEIEENSKATPEEPDAEFIDTSALTNSGELTPLETSVDKASNETEGEPGEEEEEILSPEDEVIRKEWGGKCMVTDWNRCNKMRRIHVVDVIHTPFERKSLDLNCLTMPVLCLTNGWTANRCHILCMAAQCNKQLYFEWDAIVNFEAPCKYRK